MNHFYCSLYLLHSLNLFWPLFESPDNFFQILIPYTPKIESTDIASDLGIIKQKSFLVSDSLDTYQILVSTYPIPFIKSKELHSEFEVINSTLVQEMIGYLKGTLIYQEYGELKGKNCLWFLIKFEQKSLRACLIWEHERLYSLFHYSNYEQRLSPNSKQFFESFKIIPFNLNK